MIQSHEAPEGYRAVEVIMSGNCAGCAFENARQSDIIPAQCISDGQDDPRFGVSCFGLVRDDEEDVIFIKDVDVGAKSFYGLNDGNYAEGAENEH